MKACIFFYMGRCLPAVCLSVPSLRPFLPTLPSDPSFRPFHLSLQFVPSFNSFLPSLPFVLLGPLFSCWGSLMGPYFIKSWVPIANSIGSLFLSLKVPITFGNRAFNFRLLKHWTGWKSRQWMPPAGSVLAHGSENRVLPTINPCCVRAWRCLTS